MERTARAREYLGGGPGGPGALLADDLAPGGPVTVCSGPYSEDLPVAGRSVREIRVLYADRFDLDPLSQAVVDGHEVGDDTVLGTGQLLMFMRRAGEKGASSPDR